MVDFALIGHMESWEKLAAVLHLLRGEELRKLSLEEIRDIVPWIPPRPVVRITARSRPAGRVVKGVYIDTFITPDELRSASLKTNLRKVQDAADYAVREGARVVALGGFTSIVLEGDMRLLPSSATTAFTTGNTLTAALIVKGVEQACSLHGLDLGDSRLLVVGATGDVGSGCVRYLADKTKELLLCARNTRRLEAQRDLLHQAGVRCRVTTDPARLMPLADVIILAASVTSATISLGARQPHALICDAGYPSNAALAPGGSPDQQLFSGGMGQVLGGFQFEPDLRSAFYAYPVPRVGHGCMLEGVVLALEGRFEPFSRGRGAITPESIEEIWEIAGKHGVVLAPFFNQDGLWEMQSASP